MTDFVRRSQQTVMTDALEATRQNVLQEAGDEFGARNVHGPFRAALRIAAHAQGHGVISDAEDALIGDGHSMGITTQIFQHLRRSAHWLLGIDHPVMLVQLGQELLPNTGGKRCVLAQWAGGALLLQRGDELAAEHFGEGLDRKQEAPPWPHPLSRSGQRATGDQGMHVQMATEVLLPGVQYQTEGRRPPSQRGLAAKVVSVAAALRNSNS